MNIFAIFMGRCITSPLLPPSRATRLLYNSIPCAKMRYSQVRERGDFSQYKVSVLHRWKVYYKASRAEWISNIVIFDLSSKTKNELYFISKIACHARLLCIITEHQKRSMHFRFCPLLLKFCGHTRSLEQALLFFLFQAYCHKKSIIAFSASGLMSFMLMYFWDLLSSSIEHIIKKKKVLHCVYTKHLAQDCCNPCQNLKILPHH